MVKNINNVVVNKLASLHKTRKNASFFFAKKFRKNVKKVREVYPLKSQIQEVKNAYEAYKLIKEVNQYSIKD